MSVASHTDQQIDQVRKGQSDEGVVEAETQPSWRYRSAPPSMSAVEFLRPRESLEIGSGEQFRIGTHAANTMRHGAMRSPAPPTDLPGHAAGTAAPKARRRDKHERSGMHVPSGQARPTRGGMSAREMVRSRRTVAFHLRSSLLSKLCPHASLWMRAPVRCCVRRAKRRRRRPRQSRSGGSGRHSPSPPREAEAAAASGRCGTWAGVPARRTTCPT